MTRARKQLGRHMLLVLPKSQFLMNLEPFSIDSFMILGRFLTNLPDVFCIYLYMFPAASPGTVAGLAVRQLDFGPF